MSDTKVMMDPEIKADWITALRSGEYKQIRGALRDQGGRCCLGVLCDVLDKREGTNEWRAPETLGPSWTWGGQHWSMPPVSVCEEIGLPVLDDGRDVSTLQIMNDSERKTFEQIADFIEEKL